MPRQVFLLRGINVGSANRIAMPVLREALAEVGFGGVKTYLQSGNVLAEGDPRAIIAALQQVVDVPCVWRTAAEWKAAIAANPLAGEASENPKLLQVTFRTEPAPPDLAQRLQARISGTEKVAIRGREIYSWHPDGLARSKLALALTPKGVAATARNWATVLALGDLLQDVGA